MNTGICRDLQAIIDATPGEHLTFLTTKTGKPYSGNDFSGQFRVWCDQAGLPSECSVHERQRAADWPKPAAAPARSLPSLAMPR